MRLQQLRHCPIGLALVVSACGGPLPGAQAAEFATQPTSAGATKAPDAGAIVDSGGAPTAYHIMTVLRCSLAPTACAEVARPGDLAGSYRVSFGSSPGGVRSREQAVSDLYRELRDRTSLGSRLITASRRPEPITARTEAAEAPTHPRPSGGSSDPIVEAAFDLIESVDEAGEVTVDVAHDSSSCKIALVQAASGVAPEPGDTGHRRCLLKGAERPGHVDEPTPRDREKRFGQ